MAESPHRPKPPRAADGKREVTHGDTARAADSVPVATGPFTALPTKFGRYRVDKLLGKGAMGAVYLAHDTQLDRQVALKVARVSASGSAKLIQRMEQEAKAAAKIDHSQICKVYDFGEIDGIRFIALQYIDGEDLKTYLKRVGRKRDPAEAIRLVRQIAIALEAAHDKGVIHRDLKPENIMLRKGEPVIMDFGLARRATGATDAGLTQGMIVGTAAYMSPEQAVGKAEGIDHRSDLYALGVILFEMLTGEWPFAGAAFEVMGKKCVQDPPSPLASNPEVPVPLANLCQRLIAKTKEDRFSNCAELLVALRSVDSPSSATSLIAAPTASNTVALPPSASDDQFQNFVPVEPARSKKKRKPSPSASGSAITQWWNAQSTAMRWIMIGGLSLSIALAAVVILKGGRVVEKRGSLTVSSTGQSTTPKSSPTVNAIPADAVTFQSKKYKLYIDQLTWHDARKKCQELGGRLAEVRSVAENDFLMRLAIERLQPALWLGATDEAREGTWLWNDGSGLAYNNFANGQPDRTTRGQNYLVMMIKAKPGLWCNQFPKSTDWTPGFVCEWDVPVSKTSSTSSPPAPVKKPSLTDLDFVAVGRWVRGVHATTVLPDRTRQNFQNEVLTLDRTTLKLANVTGRDVILRCDVRKLNGKNINLWLRESSAAGAYIGVYNGDSAGFVEIGSWRDNKFASIKGEAVTRATDADPFVNVAFAAIGDTLTMFIDGKRIATAFVNNSQRTGDVVLGAFEGRFELKNVEYQILDPAPAVTPITQSLPATVTPQPQLTSLAELNTAAGQASAWVSADGLRIYWERDGTSNGEHDIWQAQRSSPTDKFTKAHAVGKGRQPSLTPDELQMVYVRSVSADKFKQLFSASRKSTSDSFSNEIELKQFGERNAFNNPCISLDGMSLFVNARSRPEINATEYFVSRRKSVSAPWGPLQALNLQWDPVAQMAPLTWLFLSPDELSLLATHELDLGQFRVVKMTRPTTDARFEKFEYLSLPGFGTVYGRTPRYIPATKELFLTAPDDYASAKTLPGWKDHRPHLWSIQSVELPGFGTKSPSIPADAKTFEKNSYRFYGEQLTWIEAKTKCEQLGGNLVVIDNDYENKFVGTLIAAAAWQDSWIGISRNQSDGTWSTATGQALTYANWSPGQPNNQTGQEHYGLMSNRGTQAWRWSDQPNQAQPVHQPGFVCEWNSQNPIAETTKPSSQPGPWKKLLNGKDLTGWTPFLTTGKDNNVHTPSSGGWVMRKDELCCETNTPGWLRLDQSYGDCEFEFEFVLPRGVNSGLLVRTTGQGKLSGTNKCEIQLENDVTQNRPDQVCGGIYGIVAPTKNAFKQNAWNEMSVAIQEGTIKVRLNKQLVVDAKIAEYGALKDMPTSGYFGLFNFNGLAKGSRFRNIRIREL